MSALERNHSPITEESQAMCYTALCLVDGPISSEAIVADLGRAGFAEAEISIASASAAQTPCFHLANAPRPVAEANPQTPVRYRLVGATLGLIAGLSSISISASERSHGERIAQTTVEGPATIDGRSPSIIDASEERARTIAYHFNSGRSLITVRTDNFYEIETILEIFRGGGAIYLTHIADDGGAHGPQPARPAGAVAQSRTTVLSDRVRETA
jgi:hypothetical protein